LPAVVKRYKDSPAIKYWQVENEPYLTAYVQDYCGSNLDIEFLKEEIDLVRALDPNRRILTTDSGNLGLWAGPYKHGDLFGTTLYVYLANEKTGEIKSFVNHNFYKFKRALVRLVYGKKPMIQIETSIEPWLVKPILETPIPEQLAGMNPERAQEVFEMSSKTNFDEQYLWGVEWWYYLDENGYPEMLNWAKEEVFN
jgi:endo-1,4-beta-mannosidase